MILSSADAAAATPIAQRILERVAEVRVAGFGNPISVTCSIGIATSDTLVRRRESATFIITRIST